MRIPLLLASLLLASACQRPASVAATAAAVPATTSAMAPPADSAAAASAAVNAGVLPPAPVGAWAPPAGTGKAGRAGARAVGAQDRSSIGRQLDPADPCYGRVGVALSECLGFDTGTGSAQQADDPRIADFHAEQAQRDRDLLEQDSPPVGQSFSDDPRWAAEEPPPEDWPADQAPPDDPALDDLPPPDPGQFDPPPPPDDAYYRP